MRQLGIKIWKWHICTAFVLILAAILWADGGNSAETQQAKSQPVTKNTTTKNSEPAKKLGGDPFQYRMGGDKEGFVPASAHTLPVGIRVMAIMLVKGKKPLAVLKMPDMDDPIYCYQGDIVSVEVTADTLINAGSGKSSKRDRNLSGRTSRLKEIVYLKIDSITAQQVTLHPEKNPAGKRVLQ